jgi:hypothetical protein
MCEERGRLRVVVVDVHGGKVKAAGRDDEARQVWHLEAGRSHAERPGDGVADNVDVSLPGDVLDGEAENDEGQVRVGRPLAGLPCRTGAGEDVEEF